MECTKDACPQALTLIPDFCISARPLVLMTSLYYVPQLCNDVLHLSSGISKPSLSLSSQQYHQSGRLALRRKSEDGAFAIKGRKVIDSSVLAFSCTQWLCVHTREFRMSF